MKWLIIGAAGLALAGCSQWGEAVGLSGPAVVADVIVADQHGAVVKCVWSSKPPGVSCPGSFVPDKASGTGADGASKENPPPNVINPLGERD